MWYSIIYTQKSTLCWSLKSLIFHSNSRFLSPSLNESEFLQSRKSTCQKIIRYFDFEIWQILTNSKEQFQHKSQNMEDSLFQGPKASISILFQKRCGWKKQKNLNSFTFLYKFQNYQPWQMLFLVCTLQKISWKMTQKSQTVAHIYDLILETRIL